VDLQQLTADAITKINAADNLEILDQIRVDYLGKKGELTALLKSLSQLPVEEKKPLVRTSIMPNVMCSRPSSSES